ncbi:MAG TPA: hypothetical protein VKB93_24900 [Thermoanaerobaculia bacterium]|nr:hypothetical protein [Thermoanaerobaculia bacterium]
MKRVVLSVLFVVVVLASLGPVRNYDYFWHLATGRWITEHRALPATDPFTIASDRTPWINGEWLFEVVLYGLRGVNVSLLRSLFIAALFAVLFYFSENLLLTMLAFAGAMATLDLRPASIAALFVAIAIVIARRNNVWLYALLVVLWINVHPSALLAPVIAFLLTRNWRITLAGAAGLLVNPFGIYGVLAPLKLTLFASGGEFVNAEWLPSAPLAFPLLYLSLIVWTAAALAAAFKSGGYAAAVQMVLGLLLAYLAIAHVRNQPLWFAAFPLLVDWRFGSRVLESMAAAALVIFVAVRSDHRLGFPPERFPIAAVAHLKGLKGNIYNPDQFGGFLIWSFYPERRVLTDGRNELYHAFIPEYAKARVDGRAWNALLRKYRIDLAVDERRPPLEVLNAATGEKTRMPAWMAYWPPKEWELVAEDQAAMVFARRGVSSRSRTEK